MLNTKIIKKTIKNFYKYYVHIILNVVICLYLKIPKDLDELYEFF